MHMPLFVVRDGFSRGSCPNPSPFRLGLDSETEVRIIERCIDMSLLVQ